jgi:hypothetical protein
MKCQPTIMLSACGLVTALFATSRFSDGRPLSFLSRVTDSATSRIDSDGRCHVVAVRRRRSAPKGTMMYTAMSR